MVIAFLAAVVLAVAIEATDGMDLQVSGLHEIIIRGYFSEEKFCYEDGSYTAIVQDWTAWDQDYIPCPYDKETLWDNGTKKITSGVKAKITIPWDAHTSYPGEVACRKVHIEPINFLGL